MGAVEVLGPIVAIIAIGSALAHIRFLGRQFMADLNKLAFWVALPSLLFRSAAHVRGSAPEIFPLLGVLFAGTLLACGLGYFFAAAMRLPRGAWGTLAQSAFRGNLAYIGIPVLSGSVPGRLMPAVVVVMTLLMIFYNVLAVLVLSGRGARWGEVAVSAGTNPLVISGLAGLVWGMLGLPLEGVADRTLEALGAAAVPIALLCIGGSLVSTPLGGNLRGTFAGAALKVFALPVIVYGLGRALSLDSDLMRVALVMAACPTAAASFIMAAKMGGDPDLAAKGIVVSTLLSALPLTLALF